MGYDIADKLHLAKKKLLPVMRFIEARNSAVPFLTIEQYSDVIQASHLLKEIEYDLPKRNHRNYDFGFGVHSDRNITMLDKHRIYLNERLSVQLIELYDTLNDMRLFLSQIPKRRSPQGREDVRRGNNIVLRMKPNLKLKRNHSEYFKKTDTLEALNLMLNNFITMPASGSPKPLKDKKSLSKRSRRSKSESIISDQNIQISDPTEAIDIIIQCIRDLDRLKLLLEKGDEKSDKKTEPEDEDDFHSLGSPVEEDKNEAGVVIIKVPGRHDNKGVKIIIKQCRSDSKVDNQTDSSMFDIINASKAYNKVSSSGEVARDKNYADLKLFETHNICIRTEKSEELIISLTVTPKNGNISSKSRKPKDNYLCLTRNKVCSSLQFDVAVAETRMKNKDIEHSNPGVKSKLQMLGAEKLLQASRPAKCGRKALLDEIPRCCMPYTPSLRSLPLTEFDTEIIKQSLEMSLKKQKNSSIAQPENIAGFIVTSEHNCPKSWEKQKMVYFLKVILELPPEFTDISNLKRRSLKKKMDFYINLDNIEFRYNIYEIECFAFHKFRTGKSNKAASSSYGGKIKCSSQELHISDDEVGSYSLFKDKIEKKMLMCPFEEKAGEKKKNKTVEKEDNQLRHMTTSKIPIYRYGFQDFKYSFARVLKNLPSGNSLLTKQIEVSTENDANIQILEDKLMKDNFTSMDVRKYKIETHTIIDIRGFVNEIPIKGDKSLNVLQEKNIKRIRKRKQFFTSRSQSEIVTVHESRRGLNYLDIGPDQINNTDLSHQTKDTTSGLIVGYVANFLYDNLIKNLPSDAKENVLRNIKCSKQDK